MSSVKTQQSQHQHARAGWHRRLHARLMARNTARYNQMVEQRKRALFAPVFGTVLEIGAGTGANLAFLPRSVHYIAVEPSLAMQSYLEAEADKQGIDAEVRTGVAEQLPLEDNSVDFVISTLVLCSVGDVVVSITEIKRVLKPGGKFIFLEHVAAPQGTWARRWQNVVNPLWQLLTDGCHPNRETWRAVAGAGFGRTEIEHFVLPLWITGPHVAGVAVK